MFIVTADLHGYRAVERVCHTLSEARSLIATLKAQGYSNVGWNTFD